MVLTIFNIVLTQNIVPTSMYYLFNNIAGMFNKVNTVELMTEQVVIAMETKPCDEQPELVTSFGNLQVQVGFNHDTDGKDNVMLV